MFLTWETDFPLGLSKVHKGEMKPGYQEVIPILVASQNSPSLHTGMHPGNRRIDLGQPSAWRG